MSKLTKISAISSVFLVLLNLFLFLMPKLIDFTQDNFSKYAWMFSALNLLFLTLAIIVYLGLFQVGNNSSSKLLTFTSVIGILYSLMMGVSIFFPISLMNSATAIFGYLDLAIYALLALSFLMIIKDFGSLALLSAIASLALVWSDIEQIIKLQALSSYVFIILAALALLEALILFKSSDKK